MLEDQAPLIPLALWALNLSERAGQPDLLIVNQAGLGNALTAAGLQRLARGHVRAAVDSRVRRAGAERQHGDERGRVARVGRDVVDRRHPLRALQPHPWHARREQPEHDGQHQGPRRRCAPGGSEELNQREHGGHDGDQSRLAREEQREAVAGRPSELED